MGTLTIQKLIAFQAFAAHHMPGCTVVIAGGAPRDLLNGAEVKDIDVFVHTEDGVSWQEGCEALAKALYGDLEYHELESKEAYEGGASFELADIPQGLHMTPVQLIRLRVDPVENISKNCDFGLSQVYIDRGKLRMTQAYWRDQMNKRITFTGRGQTEQQAKSSADRYARLRVKYPKWQFVNCGRFQ